MALKGYQMRSTYQAGDFAGTGAGTTTATAPHQNVPMGTPYSTAQAGLTSSGSPVGVLVAVLVLLIALRFAAAKVGEQGDYQAIAPTFWNVLVIGLAAILGITLMKAVTLKLPSGNALRGVVQAV